MKDRNKMKDSNEIYLKKRRTIVSQFEKQSILGYKIDAYKNVGRNYSCEG